MEADATKSELGDILSQEPLIKPADTRTLIDTAKESGQPFDVVFNQAVNNMSGYSTPDK